MNIIIYINMCIHLSYMKQLASSGIYFVGHLSKQMAERLRHQELEKML